MRVKELIEELQKYDPDLEVATEVYPIPYECSSSAFIQYTFDSLTELDIEEDGHGRTFLHIW